MQAIPVQIGAKNQIVLPKAIREALGMHQHDVLLFVIENDTVIVRPRPASLTTVLRGLHAELWPVPDNWLEAERASWE
ncbi:MAG: AbrB/MazE/SpoVT family DNA-binding domain-containing protein [Anaerolineae bacterium]